MSDTRNSVTRRRMIISTAFAASSLALLPIEVSAGADSEISHAAEAIHQEVNFNAPCKRVYEALTRTAQFMEVIKLSAAVKSGMALGNKPTQISPTVGGSFTIYGGHIFGRQVELVPNERIVEAWRVIDWSPGIYSIARFALTEQGSGTKLVFDHTGFPQGLGQHLADGWHGNYWEPLAKFLT